MVKIRCICRDPYIIQLCFTLNSELQKEIVFLEQFFIFQKQAPPAVLQLYDMIYDHQPTIYHPTWMLDHF